MVKQLLVMVCLSGTLLAQVTPASGPAHIADNSFLVEEAYNQEYGVVQHIQSFTKFWDSGAYTYSFTQEWPFNPAPRHQFSYTIMGLNGGFGEGFGFGDIALNYRYQLAQTDVAAFAPRFSVLLPTGDSRIRRGAGGTGVQFNLPLSIKHNRKLATHWNIGGTLIPAAKNEIGDTAALHGYHAAQSFIYFVRPTFNLMLETVFNSSESVVSSRQTQRENTTFISPGVRWAWNLNNGVQIVPGIGVPIGVGRASGEAGVIFYLSIEHPFKKRRD
jgi:hypothetical protein